MESVDGSRILNLPAGQTQVTWKTSLDEKAKTSVFAARVRTVEGRDAHIENDSALLAVAAQSPPRILVVTGAAADATPLVAAMRAQSIDVAVAVGGKTIDAALAPTALPGLDMVVLCDLPRGMVSESRIAALQAYVQDGGGLLVTGGPQAFGPGGWSGSRLEALLPVQLDVPRTRDEPSLALALVIDRSGSMNGPKMDLTKQAARGTAEMLPVDDQIAVIAFDSQATIIVPLQRAANRLRIATDIGRIQPTGGTNILAGLREAVDQLTTARAKKKHAILLSDGQSATEGISELVDAAVSAHITVSAIGVGDAVDDALMQSIARQGGGRYYRARDPGSIPRIFSRETSEVVSSGIVERATAVLSRKRAATTSGIPWATAPQLRGYVRTHARAQTDVLLETPAGDPLLARWSLGLGQVVAWTSDVGPRWADAWARWEPFAQLWGQVARGTMRTRAARQFPVTARVRAGSVDVTVAAVSADDSFLVGLDATLEITEVQPDGKGSGTVVVGKSPRLIPLTEVAPGRYYARFPIAQGGTNTQPDALMFGASLTRDRVEVAQAVGQVSIPAAPEFRPIFSQAEAAGSGAHLLAEIASATGGGALAAPGDLFQGAVPRRRSQPLRARLLGTMALLFVADITLRRFVAARQGRPSAPGKKKRFARRPNG
ncbi:MAG: VWA domain-containing protein [Deltaproteobacteria bacterium]|nr:VWA domain-containing protein [Deltaproteobacteria bacterium]